MGTVILVIMHLPASSLALCVFFSIFEGILMTVRFCFVVLL